jgi:hypothetical protein
MSLRLQQVRTTTARKYKWKLAGFIVGGTLLTLVFCALTLLFFVLRIPSPPEVQIDASAAQKLDETFLNAAASAQIGGPSVVHADEIQLNSKLQQLLQPYQSHPHNGEGAALKDVRIKLRGDQIAAYILIDRNGRKLAFQVTGKLHTENGYILFEPEDAAVGTLSIPKSRIQAAGRQLLDTLDSPLRYRLPSNMTDIRVENGQIVFVVR